MSRCEVIGDKNDSIFNVFIDHVKSSIEDNNDQYYDSHDINFNGTRVTSYHNLCRVFNKINLIRIVTGGIYHRGIDTYNFVKFLPCTWKSESMKFIINRMNRLKGSLLFKKYHVFQRNAVQKWNPYYNEACSLIVPKFMLHDKITADGYGKCIIELLTLHGILDKCKSGKNNYEWRLSTEWETKKYSVP